MNAKQEFIDHVASTGLAVKCAMLEIDYGRGAPDAVSLATAYRADQLAMFFTALDFEYDAGYGSQFIAGYIWYTDGSWSERCEYDGSEWWEHKKAPAIPFELLGE